MPADSQAVYLAGFITEIITTPDDTGLVRTGGFAGLTEADISIVTSGPACARAMRAYDSMANNPNSGRRLYVLKVGRKRFAVQNPTSHPGMINPTIIFTDRFGFVAAFNGP